VKKILAVLVAVASLAVPRETLACSICRCGDPTFNSLGKAGYTMRGVQVALDWERFDKDQGDPAFESENMVENRFTALLSYGVSEKLTLFARLPYSVREMTDFDEGVAMETMQADGFSDPEFYAQVKLWGSGMTGGLGRRTTLSLSGGVKAPWGQDDLREDGERLEQHLQPGSGSTDVFGSLALLHLIDKKSALFASGGYRHTGDNDAGYRYGSSFLASLAYEHKLGNRLDGVAELDYRHAAKDRLDASGDEDGDTGGSLLYVTPRLLVNVGGGVVLRGAVQIPILRDLNGFQKERAIVNVGVSYLFKH
jgi:hypothetical protein